MNEHPDDCMVLIPSDSLLEERMEWKYFNEQQYHVDKPRILFIEFLVRNKIKDAGRLTYGIDKESGMRFIKFPTPEDATTFRMKL